MVSICFSHTHWCSCLNIPRWLFWSRPYSIIYYHTLKSYMTSTFEKLSIWTALILAIRQPMCVLIIYFYTCTYGSNSEFTGTLSSPFVWIFVRPPKFSPASIVAPFDKKIILFDLEGVHMVFFTSHSQDWTGQPRSRQNQNELPFNMNNRESWQLKGIRINVVEDWPYYCNAPCH